MADFIARIRPHEKEQPRDLAEDEKMKSVYTIPPVKTKIVQGGLPSDRYEYSKETAEDSSMDMLVKVKNFKAVGEPPKSSMQLLADMLTPEKPSVKMGNISGKVDILQSSISAVNIENTGVPEPGLPLEKSGITIISVPVDYKIFSDVSVWQSFASAHKIDFKNDFSKNALAVLVSMSDFPNGIFEISEVYREKEQVIVSYAVNPLNMSYGAESEIRDKYAIAQVPFGTKQIVLKQVR